MDGQAIFIKFTQGEIEEGQPYSEELKLAYNEFNGMLSGPGCSGCRRRGVMARFRPRVLAILDKYKE